MTLGHTKRSFGVILHIYHTCMLWLRYIKTTKKNNQTSINSKNKNKKNRAKKLKHRHIEINWEGGHTQVSHAWPGQTSVQEKKYKQDPHSSSVKQVRSAACSQCSFNIQAITASVLCICCGFLLHHTHPTAGNRKCFKHCWLLLPWLSFVAFIFVL